MRACKRVLLHDHHTTTNHDHTVPLCIHTRSKQLRNRKNIGQRQSTIQTFIYSTSINITSFHIVIGGQHRGRGLRVSETGKDVRRERQSGARSAGGGKHGDAVDREVLAVEAWRRGLATARAHAVFFVAERAAIPAQEALKSQNKTKANQNELPQKTNQTIIKTKRNTPAAIW